MTDLLPLDWSEPKKVSTRNGERLLRKAAPTETFWALWKAQKAELKAAGYSCSCNDGVWEVCHWGLIVKSDEEVRQEVAALEMSRATDAEINIPLSERARERGFDYFGFQRAGVSFCASRPAALLGDDMGVGKTIQIIGVINVNGAKRVLIVCPASMLLTWAKELYVWLAEELPITVITASKVKGLDDEQFPGINEQVTFTDTFPRHRRGVFVINYDILHKFEDQLRSVEWDVVAFDESQYVKNTKARRTQYAFGRPARKATFKKAAQREIAPIPGKVRICASGTPMKNRPIELFSQLHYLDPVAWPNFFRFAQRYCGAVQNGFGWDFNGSSNLEELNVKLRSTIMIRRMKTQVLLDLPAKTRQVISIPANGAAKLLEREIAAHAAWEAAKLAGNIGGMGLAATELAAIRVEVGLAKVKHVLAHLEEIDQPTLIFCRHHEVQAQLAEALKDRGVVTYNGKMNAAQREEAKTRFMTDDSIQFFVGTMAAKEGLTLTKASYVLFAELEWAPADLNQAEDRACRQGQKNAVLVQHLVYDGSLDDKMLVDLLKKQRVIDAALDREVNVQQPEEVAHPELVDAFNNTTVTAKPKENTPTFSKEAWDEAQRKAEEAKANDLTPEQVKLIHTATQVLAGVCDYAGSLDGAGFNKMDAHFGHQLANQDRLTQGQAKAAKKMVRKYKRQLGDLYEAIYGEVKESA